MEELENKHTSEVAKLQKQIDALDNQIIRLQMSNSKRYAQYSYKTAPTILIFSIAMGADYSFNTFLDICINLFLFYFTKNNSANICFFT